MASNLVYMLVAALFIVNTHFCNGWKQHSTSSSVVVQGKVICNPCSNPGPSNSSYFIPGASVAVECSLNRKTATSVRLEGETNEMGEFKIEIPLLFHCKLERCSAQLIRSPHASCNVPSIATSPNFILNADLDGVRTYSAGTLSYRPHIVPSACYTKDSDSDIFFIHGREALEKDDESKATGNSPAVPTLPTSSPKSPAVPSIPNLNSPPLSPLSFPTPLPGIPPLPNVSFPPFSLPGIPPLPNVSFPPFSLPGIPPLLNVSFPPFSLPGIPPLLNVSFPPLPLTNVTIPKPPPFPLNFPPLPLTNVTIPKPPPFPLNFPPLPLLIPPPPSK